MILVRRATTADQTFFRELKNDVDALFWAARGTPVTESEHATWFARALRDPDIALLVAVDEGGTPVGYARITTCHESRISFAVVSEHRQKGIGTALLETCEEIARIKVIPTLMAYVHPGNTESLRAFRARGYVLHEQRGIFQTLSKEVTG